MIKMEKQKTIIGKDPIEWDKEVNEEFKNGKWRYVFQFVVPINKPEGTEIKYIAILVAA